MTFASKWLFWPGGRLGRDLALVGRLVRQHRLAHHVADGEDVRDVGPLLLVDRDVAALVHDHARVLGPDQPAVRPAPDATRILSKVSVAGALPPSKLTTSPSGRASTLVTFALRWMASYCFAIRCRAGSPCPCRRRG
jgi:hypothetical protein